MYACPHQRNNKPAHSKRDEKGVPINQESPVELTRAVPPTNTNFRLTTRLQEAHLALVPRPFYVRDAR